MRKMVFTTILLLVIPLLISSCNTINSDIGAYEAGTHVSPQQMNSVIDGKALQNDIVGMLGYPTRKEQINSKEIWYYDHTKIRHIGANINESTVFEFDIKGKLIKHYKTGKSGNPLLEEAKKQN